MVCNKLISYVGLINCVGLKLLPACIPFCIHFCETTYCLSSFFMNYHPSLSYHTIWITFFFETTIWITCFAYMSMIQISWDLFTLVNFIYLKPYSYFKL